AFPTAAPIEYLPQTQAPLDPNVPLDAPFVPMPSSLDTLQWQWPDFQNDLLVLAGDGLSDVSLAAQTQLPDSSPTESYLEARSFTSSGSDNGWTTVDYRPSFDYTEFPHSAIFNPGEALHIRSQSNSSQSDLDQSHYSYSSSFEGVDYPLNSPDSEAQLEVGSCSDHSHSYQEHSPVVQQLSGSVSPPTSVIAPVPVKQSPSTRTSPKPAATAPASGSGVNAGSPSTKKNSRKSPIAKTTKPGIRRPSQPSKKDTEKRVGRRRGPLRPDQRKQACEIRKLRACLRCKFLKKTCDPGEPCNGCQPSHARLWQVPCTRIDIKDIGYFMKDWRVDFERHVTLGFSVGNIKGFAQEERLLYITHGYGFVLPVQAREVYVRDEDCFNIDWTESIHETPREFSIPTARLSAGKEGISTTVLSEYLDQHIDGGFEKFIDQYFEGTPFLTEILRTAYRYYRREKLPVIRKALKLVLAYNLTMHVTMVQGVPEEEGLAGKVDDDGSKFQGKHVAPVMINFQVKCALAEMWRELQKDILEELSALYSSVYTGEKLKNWPTIFMLAAILLAVWEEMQFDCHYRVPDPSAVQKFCNDMETTPVGVIVGLFSAISQKLPAFMEWDTQKHHHLLNSNEAVCDAMTEMREHVTKYEDYLKTRPSCKFDRQDFDSLSNKFLAKLVLRA
ncbi:hypothetical protein L228DRAFT_199094, partial [Xylona heveae TC161]